MTEHVVIVPDLKSGAFVVGGKYGKGYLYCRNKSGPGCCSGCGLHVNSVSPNRSCFMRADSHSRFCGRSSARRSSWRSFTCCPVGGGPGAEFGDADSSSRGSDCLHVGRTAWGYGPSGGLGLVLLILLVLFLTGRI